MPAETYEIHDNGGRPFKVDIKGDLVTVFSLRRGGGAYQDEPTLVLRSQNIFVGLSPGDDTGRYNGNSILVVQEDRCVFIGERIFSFHPRGRIVEFTSRVGNSDVPYPWAKDEHGNVYLLIENVILGPRVEAYGDDPYEYYYNDAQMTPDGAYKPPRQAKNPPFRNIINLLLGADTYTLTYTPFPAKDYVRVTRDIGPMTFSLADGTHKEVSQQEYVELMEAYGEAHAFWPLDTATLVERLCCGLRGRLLAALSNVAP